MPEPKGLSTGSYPALELPQPGARTTPDAALRAVEADLAGRDRGRERITLYWILLVSLAGGAVFLRDTPWEGSLDAHTLLEVVATVLAFIVGALALVRFYSRKQATFLLIGTGFLGAALLDLNHAVLTADYFLGPGRISTDDLFAWTWMAERVFLSVFLFVSLLAWKQETREGEGKAVSEAFVYVIALLLTLACLFFVERVPLSRAHFPVLWLTRPAELIPGFLFFLALVGYLTKGGWRQDAFEHWLLISLLIGTMCHVGYASVSETRFDGMFDAAHLLKLASYAAMLAGLMFSVYQTFRRESRVLRALTDANEALAQEVEVRAETEQVVNESRARLQDFLDNASDLIQSVAPDGKILYVNSAWKRTLGYSDEQLELLNLLEIVHPAHLERVREEFDRVLAGEPARPFQVEFLAATGRIVILSGSVAAQLVRGRPVATQGIFRDVTEQRLAERQLADSRANLAALVENTGDSIWSVDRNHRLITFNSAFALATEARTGREPQVGHLPFDVFPPDEIEWYAEVYRRALRGDRHVALRTDEVGGQIRYFELYANPIQGDEGISGAVLFGKDVTPRVRAEAALRVAKDQAESANKAKSHFLASMSHELRTPLNSVIGFTNILLKNKHGQLTDKDVGFLQRVLANGKHLLDLINEVLDLAKIEAGRMELVFEEVDLGELVTETVQQLEGQVKVKEGNVQLIHEVPAEVATIETDPAKLKQVIINLVGNALKFTEEGSVTVRLDLAGDGRTPVAIVVRDTGIGIGEDRLEGIFEAFQQAEAGTARKYGGTGLGLAISRSMCLLMGYDLIVESTLGVGSTFSIVMGERAKKPARPPESEAPDEVLALAASDASMSVAAAGEAETPTPSPLSDLAGFTVLVVDDENDSRVLMRHYLEEFGCRVVTAAGGDDGIASASSHHPDLITLDLMMPDMTGSEVLERLKADPELEPIPVVVVSIVAGEGGNGLSGAADLLTKPFEREDLLRVLRRNLLGTDRGSALVLADAPGEREVLMGLLKQLAFEVTAAEGVGAGLAAVESQGPDVVLLDLASGSHGVFGFLEKLREGPSHRTLPVLVVLDEEPHGRDRRRLVEMASGVLVRGEAMGQQLTEALDSLFPRAARTGVPT